ncbi:MAG: S41 family peptidase [Acidobacteriota bacterium]|jgi:carboxyl-terminal processing protease|nr:S41 family peptidase [Acidobacteriota bacterium]NLT33164.1 S41 family peptidase [Acidobacteriota bacterium]
MKHGFAILLVSVVAVFALVGGLLGDSAFNRSAADASTPPNEFLANFTEALEVIQLNYVEPVGSDKLVYSSIKGMLRRLDPHSSFLDPKEFARLREDQHSRYYGLGIRVRPLLRDKGRHVIVEPPAIGTPAEKRGLRAGDVITRIEGEPIDDWTSDDVVGRLKGPRGTTVDITIERPGVREPIEVTIERDEIPMVTVPYAFEIKPGIGYIKIDRFSESTAKELEEKLEQLQGLSGLVLDLRDNPGGLLNQAIAVSDFFLPRGELIVSTKGRAAGSTKSYAAPGEERIRVPLVVLINRHSASASEIVSGALQDHDRALIVGETSFGKGLVQSVFTLDNDTGMALTTAKYYTPSGRLIQRDYSGSNLEYYYLEGEPETPPLNNEGEREVYSTDGKRKVYGGGGITPDVVEPARELNRFEMLLSSKDIFFQYARRLTSGEVPFAEHFQNLVRNGETAAAGKKGTPDFQVTDAVLADFGQFLKERNVEYTDEEIAVNVDYIKRRIRQEVFTSALGIQEGYKIGVEGDNQVLKALEVMPEAKSLMTSRRIITPAPPR